MPAFARRPTGDPARPTTYRLAPEVLSGVEDFARKKALSANLAAEQLLRIGLAAVTNDKPETSDAAESA